MLRQEQYYRVLDLIRHQPQNSFQGSYKQVRRFDYSTYILHRHPYNLQHEILHNN